MPRASSTPGAAAACSASFFERPSPWPTKLAGDVDVRRETPVVVGTGADDLVTRRLTVEVDDELLQPRLVVDRAGTAAAASDAPCRGALSTKSRAASQPPSR